jgi:hypothetical protein
MLKEESPFLACKKVFSALYNKVDNESIKKVAKHPNNYFIEAYKYTTAKPKLENL